MFIFASELLQVGSESPVVSVAVLSAWSCTCQSWTCTKAPDRSIELQVYTNDVLPVFKFNVIHLFNDIISYHISPSHPCAHPHIWLTSVLTASNTPHVMTAIVAVPTVELVNRSSDELSSGFAVRGISTWRWQIPLWLDLRRHGEPLPAMTTETHPPRRKLWKPRPAHQLPSPLPSQHQWPLMSLIPSGPSVANPLKPNPMDQKNGNFP